MTRVEIEDALGQFMDSTGLAREVCHDGFDSFVEELTTSQVYEDADSLVTAWSWFKKGWDAA